MSRHVAGHVFNFRVVSLIGGLTLKVENLTTENLTKLNLGLVLTKFILNPGTSTSTYNPGEPIRRKDVHF